MITKTATPKCVVCKIEGHTFVDCPIAKASHDIIALFKSMHLCFYCGLHKYNRNSPCRKLANNELMCGTCGSNRHCTELHPKNFSPGATEQISQSTKSTMVTSSTLVTNSVVKETDENIMTISPTFRIHVKDEYGKLYDFKVSTNTANHHIFLRTLLKN